MIALLLSVLILASAVPTQIQYNVGDDYQFQFSSFLNHSAKSAIQGTQGSLSSMTGIMEIECQDWDGKLFYFVMNLFNVDVEAANGLGRRKSLNVGDDGLGLDMFFAMTPQGQIPDIWYQDGDDMFFVNVKASAINALQTHIVPLSVKPVFQESDQIGTHNTQFSSVLQATALNVFKTFTQNDVIQFADKSVSKATFQLMGQSVVQIDATGFIRSSSTSQQVTFRSVLSGQSQKRASEIGFDGNLYSHGAFQLSVISQNQNKRVSASFKTASKVKSSLMEIGSKAADAKNIAKVSNVQQLIFLLEDNPTKTNYHELRTVANLFEAKPAFLKEVSPVLIKEVQKPNKGVLLNRFLFVLGLVDSTQTNSVLREMLSVESLQLEVARSLTTSRVTDCTLIPAVQALTKSKQGREDYLLAFGSLTRRCATHDARQKASTYLNQLQTQAQKTNDAPLAAAVQGAMQNAGLAAPVAIQGSDYPFNKSFDKNLTVGGSVLNANFELDLFIGTNFDCNQKYFNYLASAEASATIDFLGTAKNAFEARGIYGKDNGVSAGDQIYVRVWDDVVYNQQIPQIDCSVHQYPIGTWQSPGFDVTYTIWISVIPVTFTAGVDVQLALDWAWQVCDSTLSVQVELIPDGKLVAFASAQSDLIIIEGGIELDADFELTPKPQAFIHGSECEVGFDVEASYDPMEAELGVWWRENVCEWWIFDCHWGPYHTDSLWSWNAAQRNVVLLKETWKIQK